MHGCIRIYQQPSHVASGRVESVAYHLHDTGYPHDALLVVVLSKVAVYPVKEIEGPIRAESEHVVRCEILHL